MKVAAGLNSCLKRDQAWTGSSACAQVPLLGQPGSSPAAGGRGEPLTALSLLPVRLECCESCCWEGTAEIAAVSL